MMNDGKKVLIIEDYTSLCETFERILSKGGYRIDTALNYDRAVVLLGQEDYDVIFADINLVGERTGIDLLKEVRRRNIYTPVVIITGFPGVDTASEAVRHGAFDYLCKPVEKDTLLRVARTAARHKALGETKSGNTAGTSKPFSEV